MIKPAVPPNLPRQRVMWSVVPLEKVDAPINDFETRLWFKNPSTGVASIKKQAKPAALQVFFFSENAWKFGGNVYKYE